MCQDQFISVVKNDWNYYKIYYSSGTIDTVYDICKCCVSSLVCYQSAVYSVVYGKKAMFGRELWYKRHVSNVMILPG